MEREELVQRFIRVEKTESGLSVQVEVISWPHPGEPAGEWVEVESLPLVTSEAELRKCYTRILRRRRFFKRCDMCGKLQPDGWMCDADTCQSCAERHLGVVF